MFIIYKKKDRPQTIPQNTPDTKGLISQRPHLEEIANLTMMAKVLDNLKLAMKRLTGE